MYQALYRKYRPLTFSDVVGQGAVTQTLVGQLSANKVGHAYLFTGTRGTGKTTCAKIFARAVNCEHPTPDGNPCNECASCRGILDGSVTDVFEIDAASNNSVDNVRELREDVIYTPAVVKYKVYIIDEVHRMSGPAFDALLKTIEEPPAHVIFILATTELHKVPATILSRCQRFDFRRIDAADIAERLLYVAGQEGIDLTEDAAAMLGRMGQGSMRDALSLLERATALEGRVDAAAVGDLLGMCDPESMMNALFSIADSDTAAVLEFLNDMWKASKDIGRLLSEMTALLRDVALSDIAPNLVATTRSSEEVARMRELLSRMGRAKVLSCLETLQKGIRDIALCNDSRVMTEITLMRMCDERLSTDPAAMVARLEALESGVVVKAEPAAKPKAEKSAPKAEAAPKAVPTPTPKPTPAPEAKVDPKAWNRALEYLGQTGRGDIVNMIPSRPRIENNLVIFEMEKGFARDYIESREDFKETIAEAVGKTDGKSYKVRFADPTVQKSEGAEDPLDSFAQFSDIEIR